MSTNILVCNLHVFIKIYLYSHFPNNKNSANNENKNTNNNENFEDHKIYLGFNIKINAATKQRNWQRQYCKIYIVSKFHSFKLSHILTLQIQSQKHILFYRHFFIPLKDCDIEGNEQKRFNYLRK